MCNRITTLRNRTFDRKIKVWRYPTIATAESLRITENIKSLDIRFGLKTKHILSSLKFEIDDLEIIAGRPCRQQIEADEDSYNQAAAFINDHFPTGGQNGHCELNRTLLFELGIDGLIEHIHSFEQNNARKAFVLALEGLGQMIENLAGSIMDRIEHADEQRKKELHDILESCRNISHKPPKTFREALQLLWLVDMAVMLGDNAWLVVSGHIDRTLWPFYKNDIESGLINRNEALELIESLYIITNEVVPDGLAMSVMVSGTNAEGKDTTNELSYLCMEAVRNTSMVYPTVGLCWNENTPDDLVNLTVDLISEGYTTPAFFCDNIIRKGLESYGVPPNKSHNYINSTCVEITPVGASNVWVASPYFNLCLWLLKTIEKKADKVCNHFEDFLEEYFAVLQDGIINAVNDQINARMIRHDYSAKPLQSIFTDDCVKLGKDIDRGGALYNWVECSFVGLANLADSLIVIKHEVFEKKNLNLKELKALLESDYDNNEHTRLRFLNSYPKYGQANKEADSLVQRIATYFINECKQYKIPPDNSPFIPGTFCWVMHEFLGRQTIATPDGRKKGFPFADGGGPAQGRETCGPTSGVLSITSWDHSPLIGGLAYNMKFSKQLVHSPEGKASLKHLIVTYLKKGGFETQINVVDREILLKAQKYPDQYRDLVVRIGGYCDYFTKLSPQMQAEVLLRTEFKSLAN